MPDNVINASDGQAFVFTKVLNIAGTIKRKPRDIKREISLNCKVQKSESVRIYEVQSFEQFPLWKSDEVEDMMHANHFTMNGRAYIFPGGEIFKTLYKCKDYSRLVMPLQDCREYQIFGCAEKCDDDNVRYYPLRKTAANYYSTAGLRVAGNLDELMAYLRAQDGVTDVCAVDFADTGVSYYAVVKVLGNSRPPAFILADGIQPNNRIYAQQIAPGEIPTARRLFGLPADYTECPQPTTDVVTIEVMICTPPVAGAITFEHYCTIPTSSTVYIENE